MTIDDSDYLKSIPLDVLEGEIKRRLAENQRKEEMLEFLRTSPDGYQHYGCDIDFGLEDLIRFLHDSWQLCPLSGASDFKDVEAWLRHIIFGKTDLRRLRRSLRKGSKEE